ncbi:hypothetical protein [uncultured Nostoc sp.]|uniref:hypothetical protein n=1 Tax=uncultured Nostoc sp. TaxID=340711 RepID=UPI0035C969D4
MENTLFTTLTATEEASLSGGNDWKKSHKPVKKPSTPSTPSTSTTTTTNTTTNTLLNISTIVTGSTIAIAGKGGTAVAVSGDIDVYQVNKV